MSSAVSNSMRRHGERSTTDEQASRPGEQTHTTAVLAHAGTINEDNAPTAPTQARALLQTMHDRLTREVAEGNQLRVREDSFEAMAGEAPDLGDIAVATEQGDLRNAQVGRDATELRAVQAALRRLDDGSYGWCSSCGQSIEQARLLASPAVERCVPCQSRLERTVAGFAPPVPRTL